MPGDPSAAKPESAVLTLAGFSVDPFTSTATGKQTVKYHRVQSVDTTPTPDGQLPIELDLPNTTPYQPGRGHVDLSVVTRVIDADGVVNPLPPLAPGSPLPEYLECTAVVIRCISAACGGSATKPTPGFKATLRGEGRLLIPNLSAGEWQLGLTPPANGHNGAAPKTVVDRFKIVAGATAERTVEVNAEISSYVCSLTFATTDKDKDLAIRVEVNARESNAAGGLAMIAAARSCAGAVGSVGGALSKTAIRVATTFLNSVTAKEFDQRRGRCVEIKKGVNFALPPTDAAPFGAGACDVEVKAAR